MTDQRMINTEEAAELRGVSERRIIALIQSGRLPAARFGNGKHAPWAMLEEDVINLPKLKPGPKAKKKRRAE